MSRDTQVSASEVADFVFCSRCWWLRLHGLKPDRSTPEMVAGTVAHNRMQRDRERVFSLRSVAVFVIGIGLLLCLLVFLINMFI